MFTSNGTTPVSGFSKAKARLDALMPAGTSAWVIQDLRRSFASGCAKLGIGIHVVEKHDFADEKRVAMTTWANDVETLVNGEPA